ncbi:MAG: PAS domain S-box protein [Candidatus Latescibacteria bacterium]|nr:PAS domain S-box protein [Candidatus Latescibacterota bacterium]
MPAILGSRSRVPVYPVTYYAESNRRLQRLLEEQKAAEEKLAAREQQFRNLLDATPDAMVVSNAEGVISMVNRQAESLLGYSREELLGQRVELLVPERLRPGHPALR